MRLKQNNKFVNRWIMFTGVCLLLFLLVGCHNKSKDTKPTPPTVRVSAVAQQDVPISVEFSGTLKSVKTVDIIPRVSGYIERRYFKEGDLVEEGDPLYLIDPRPFEAALDHYNALLRRDEALLAFYENEVIRYTKLAAKGAASEEKKEAVVANLNETIANIARDKADIANAELNLSFTRINAPFSGRIQVSRIKVGQLVEEQRDILTTLIQTDPIHVIFFIPRSQFYTIQMGERQGEVVSMNDMSVMLTLPDGTEYSQKGKLDFTSFQIDPTTDSIMVRAIFENIKNEKNREYDLIPGQYTPVKLIIGEYPNTLLMPEPALIEDEEGRHVYIVNKDNKVENRVVKIGQSYKNQWMVLSGLKKGEKVIVEGIQKVRDGMVVKPEPYSSKTETESSEKDNSSSQTNTGKTNKKMKKSQGMVKK